MLRLRVTLAVVLIAVVSTPLGAMPVTTARLRPQSSRIRAWLAHGREHSPTVRALADRVERSDVVVYLELDWTPEAGVLACVTWMSAAPGVRYLRVSMRADLRLSDGVAMLAHELQHVVEVADHLDVRSNDELTALYQRIGHRAGSSGRAWDTLAALRAGDLARRDLSTAA